MQQPQGMCYNPQIDEHANWVECMSKYIRGVQGILIS